jgi:hypothetical protein
MRRRLGMTGTDAERPQNRRVGEPYEEVRAARSRALDPAARRRAERRVRLLAALLDGGGSGLQAP